MWGWERRGSFSSPEPNNVVILLLTATSQDAMNNDAYSSYDDRRDGHRDVPSVLGVLCHDRSGSYSCGAGHIFFAILAYRHLCNDHWIGNVDQIHGQLNS